MATPEEAKATVQRLAEKYGYLDKDMMDDIANWKPEYRERIDKNWLAMETAAAHSIKTLAKQIYGSGARFVFELLQNADDNKFDTAKEDNSLPFITFKMFHEHIIVECNEDGFRKNDLEAICAVGESTKAASGSGYIGNKGIGFKSVFIAASMVYIQSGNYSFQFHHKKTDPGLGMVRPEWKDAREELQRPLTRMTLTFHDDGDPKELDHLRTIIRAQLNDLQETCLLFLKRLQRIKIELYDKDGHLESSKRLSKHVVDDYRVSLETTSYIEDGTQTTQSQIYHITRKHATGLERSENRDAPDSAEGKRLAATAEIVLAFPLTEDSKPITSEKQFVFAFLPMKKLDYTFLIHTDFDTNASREDVVTTSKRNLDLIGWIAKTFIQAVLEFCNDPSLCHEWPSFLPPLEAEKSTSSFWLSLNNRIAEMLILVPVLKSRNRPHLRLISDVLQLIRDAQLADGTPVLDDTAKDLFLSPKYAHDIVQTLATYGLRRFDAKTFVDMLEADIAASDSKMCGAATTQEWHTVVAKLLVTILDKGHSLKPRLERLTLLPLRGGNWVSSLSTEVYFPTTKNVTIPDDVGISIIQADATSNSHRRSMFEKLGASEASSNKVRSAIFSKFASSTKGPRLLRDFNTHLRYLYLTSQPGSQRLFGTKEEFGKVILITHDSTLAWPHLSDIYLSEQNHPYGPESLLSSSGAAPGLSVVFANPMYTPLFPPSKPSSSYPSWEAWLYEFVGVRERLRLLDKNTNNLSDTSRYVLEHRPNKFLGLLEYLWIYDGPRVRASQSIQQSFRDLPAKGLCGVNFPVKFKDTWLPLQSLRRGVTRYMEHSDHFPFLKFEPSEEAADEFGVKWAFTHKYFGVGVEESITFLLEILRQIQISCPNPVSASRTHKICDLYLAVNAKLTTAESETVEKEKIRTYFSRAGVFIPDEKNTSWSKSGDCLWLAPPDMKTKHSLRTLYARTVGEEQLRNIENLFSRTAMIPAASSADVVAELQKLREIGCTDLDRIKELYKFLKTLNTKGSTLNVVFNNNALIYARKHSQWDWYKTTDCLWSSTTSIRGKVTLDAHYEELRMFFVKTLGVRMLTLQLVYDELKQTKTEQSISELTMTISAFSSLLETEEHFYLDPKPIREAAIFPVSYCGGPAMLRATDTEFAIGDRDYLREKFENKISLLDFDLKDVRRLKPFFEWLGLTDRYLSNCVKEHTSVSDNSGQLIRSGPRDLKLKAYHILRVAATFSSTRYHISPSGLYESLRSMKVKETDSITTKLSIEQNDTPISIEEAAGDEHIDEPPDGLTIYVPRKRRAQEICFGTVLPRKFAEWLMRNPSTDKLDSAVDDEAVKALTAVFACGRFALDEILDHQGIIQVSIQNQDPEEEEEEEEDHQDDGVENLEEDVEPRLRREDVEDGESANALHEEQHHGPLDVRNQQQETFTAHANDTHLSEIIRQSVSEAGESETETLVETVTHQSHMSYRPTQDNPTRPARPYRSPQPSTRAVFTNSQRTASPRTTYDRDNNADNARYSELLSRVVAAGERATVPSLGTFDFRSMSDALADCTETREVESFDGLDVQIRFRSIGQFERDKKVGAAGELYVFELLSRLNLPDWGRGNWQSRIRTYAAAHPSYANIEAWTASETSDIVYDDTRGHFTNFLIECDYLDEVKWRGARPKYFLEVKSTTGPPETPFYVSPNQYRLMEQKHLSEDRSEVYIILRVFWLSSEKIGMCLYLDPWQLKEDRKLLFRGQSWAVTPGAGAGT